MVSRVQKPHLQKEAQRIIKGAELPDEFMRFSFRYFHATEKFGCDAVPAEKRARYWNALMERLKSLSNMRMSEFISKCSKALRNHTHKWDGTSEPGGFSELGGQLRDYEPWQFSIDQQRYGRIHGIIQGNVFQIIWLDPEHQLYPWQD